MALPVGLESIPTITTGASLEYIFFKYEAKAQAAALAIKTQDSGILPVLFSSPPPSAKTPRHPEADSIMPSFCFLKSSALKLIIIYSFFKKPAKNEARYILTVLTAFCESERKTAFLAAPALVLEITFLRRAAHSRVFQLLCHKNIFPKMHTPRILKYFISIAIFIDGNQHDVYNYWLISGKWIIWRRKNIIIIKASSIKSQSQCIKQI
jgi:hypothetical protein